MNHTTLKTQILYIGQGYAEYTNTTQHQIQYNLPITINVEEIASSKPKFTLYPNPNDGQFTIDLNTQYRHVQLTISDITGRLLATTNHQNVSSIPAVISGNAGIYFVRVSTGTGESEVLKVVKY